MATPRKTPRTTFRTKNNLPPTPAFKRKTKRTAEEIKNTLAEILALTKTSSGTSQMSTPSNSDRRPTTRSNKKKAASEVNLVDLTGSPTLRGKKRAKSGEVHPEEPLPK